MIVGPRLAKSGTSRRGLRAFAGRSCGPLGLSKAEIQNSRFKITESGRSLRSARSSGPAGRELRASAAGRLRPANRCAIDSAQKARSRAKSASKSSEAAPQPSGWACDVKKQPSARGRLRAAGRYATDFASTPFPLQSAAADCGGSLQELQIQNSIFNIENSELRTRDAACEGWHEQTRVAGLRRAKLRPARPFQGRKSKFKIQNYGIGSQPAERTLEADLRDASCGPPPPGGCGPLGPGGPNLPATITTGKTAARSVPADRFFRPAFPPQPRQLGPARPSLPYLRSRAAASSAFASRSATIAM